MSADTKTDFRALALQLASTALDIAGYIDPDIETTITSHAYSRGEIRVHVHQPAPKDAAEILARRLGLDAYRFVNDCRHEWSGTVDDIAVAVDWMEPRLEDES